jgi:hypothetical protein
MDRAGLLLKMYSDVFEATINYSERERAFSKRTGWSFRIIYQLPDAPYRQEMLEYTTAEALYTGTKRLIKRVTLGTF